MFPLRSDLLVKLSDLTSTASGNKVTGATVAMALFEEVALKFNSGPAVSTVQKVTPSSTVINTFLVNFTLGGNSANPANYEVKVGDELVGAAATAIVKSVTLVSGSWGAGDAVGNFELTNQVGDFAAETLDIGATTAVVAVTGNTDQGGTFTLSFDGSTTSAIDGNATLSAIKAALEALGNITTVNVTGNPLDTDPVSNGFYVEWAAASPEGDGNVPLLTVGIVSLLGPTSVSVSEVVQGHLVGVARNAGAGKVGLPIEAHGRVAGDYVHIIGSANYDGEEDIVSVSRDEIVVTATYVAEVFAGKEELFLGINGTGLPGITLGDDGGGDYSAYLPEDLEKYTRGKRCILLVTVDDGAGLDLLIAKTSTTGFYKGT